MNDAETTPSLSPFENLFAALSLIAAEHKRTGEWGGEVACPACGGALRWSKARSNGHVHGVCSTAGCLRWMQ